MKWKQEVLEPASFPLVEPTNVGKILCDRKLFELTLERKNLFVQEAFAVFEELPSDDDSAASNNSDTDDED
ncbi:hypothetical protein TNCV_474671 [Trichonephila clavipes]|nr:hypothetical protein TNCV_474671 [Trichonephila clavipes]